MEVRKSILRRIEREFSRAAKAYVTETDRSQAEELELLLANAGALDGCRALDIATGGGHTAIALAKAGARVAAIDGNYEMLDAASGFAAEQGVTVDFCRHSTDELPWEAESFDLITCRAAPHHFVDLKQFIAEAARVLVPEGRFMIIDQITPANPVFAAAVNEIEKHRDASHVEAYTTVQWIDRLADAGFDPILLVRWRRTTRFREWAEAAMLPEAEKASVERDIRGYPEEVKRYLRVVESGGGLDRFDHEAALFVSLLRPA
jgi:ubiquinone/menaquinone biosynthesis C-methylase UbiE